MFRAGVWGLDGRMGKTSMREDQGLGVKSGRAVVAFEGGFVTCGEKEL